MKKMMLTVVKIADVITITFYENGKIVATLVQREIVEKAVFDISVFSQGEVGRVSYLIEDEQVNFVDPQNWVLVSHWFDQCKLHLRLPL
jgi:hypothetical protein